MAPEVIVLLTGFSRWTREGKQRAGGTVTLIKGTPNVIVDTGAPEQRDELLQALAAQALVPMDIAWVVLTHGHLDHVGNNNLFPHATFVLESDIGRNGEYWIHQFDKAPLLIETGSGAPPLQVIATRGHTDHCLSVIVEASIGRVAIVGDLFGHDGDWVDNVWQEYTRDRALQQRSRDAVLATADYVVPGHGPMFRVRKE